MKMSDGIEFKIGMTVYTFQNNEEICIETNKENCSIQYGKCIKAVFRGVECHFYWSHLFSSLRSLREALRREVESDLDSINDKINNLRLHRKSLVEKRNDIRKKINDFDSNTSVS